MSDKRSIKILGNIMMLLSFAFIINRIIKYKINFAEILSVRTISILVISIITYAIVVIVLANIFYQILKLCGNTEISKNDSIFIYSKSNLYKYLPGNIFHYIGRNQIATNEGTSHGTVIAATIAEMLLLTFASVVVTVVFAGQYAIKWSIHQYSDKSIIIMIMILIVIILFAFNSIIKKWIIKYTNQLIRHGIKVYRKFIMVYIITFIVNGAMFIMVLYSLGGHLNGNLILPVIGMYTFSWLIGFATPGAPAGLGIREAIMTVLIVDVVGVEIVITAVILYRIVTTLGDVVGYILAHQLLMHENREYQ